MLRRLCYLLLTLLIPSAVIAQGSGTSNAPKAESRVFTVPGTGRTVEKQLLPEDGFTPWIQDQSQLPAPKGDRVETHQVLEKNVRIIKLQNLLPPILFGSGEAHIPISYLDKVRGILNGMKDRRNVRLHVVGHTDNAQLIGEVLARYRDNMELSRERAGIAAEFFQKALKLPAEAVSYEGLGEKKPTATNNTAAGRAQNRRIEVEVWYDEIDEKLVDKKVVIPENIKRIKICRVEEMCRISFKAGHARRTRVKNLIAPFQYDDDATAPQQEYQQKVRQVLRDLADKQGVVVKFIAHTDSTPLAGRDERIYGNHLAMSKARARRMALAIQEALKLPTNAIESDGKGASNPVAGNDTEAGRAANRRIEVEFWYDDALQVMSSEPQLCPEEAGAETVTRVYNSPNTILKPVVYESGKPVIPEGLAQALASVMAEIKDKAKVRLRFVGYTNNERLDRRLALAYGDDIGLSTARAHRLARHPAATLAHPATGGTRGAWIRPIV